MRMAELQKILQSNGTFKAELMQAFLSAAKASFQEHSKTGDGKGHGKGHNSQKVDTSGLASLSQSLFSGASVMPSTSDSTAVSSDSVGGGGLSGVDSPSSLHSPGGSYMDLSSFAALDNFLFEQGLPSTPGQGNSMEASPDMQVLNSPFNLNNVSLDPVSNAASPLSDFGVGSPQVLPSSSVANGGSDSNLGHSANSATLLNMNANTVMTSTTSTTSTPTQQQQYMQQVQQYQQLQQQQQQQQQQLHQQFTSASVFPPGTVQIKTEPGVMPEPTVKTEPLSPTPLMSPLMDYLDNCLDVGAIMDEVRQIPSESRRVLIDQVTDLVVEAHLATTINTHSAVAEAVQHLHTDTGMPDMSKLTLDPSTVWQKFMECMVPEIQKCVKFCKRLPGFQEIEQDDQIRLIKQGSFEVMFARFSMLVDHQRQEMLDPTHTMLCPRQVVRGLKMGEFLDEFFFVAAHFNPLKLTDGEIGLFTSVLIICPDRKNLRNKRPVGKIQSLFLQALYYLMKHNHPDPDAKFQQLMGLITMFRRINEEHSRALNNIRMKSPEEFNREFPDLHKEIYDWSESTK